MAPRGGMSGLGHFFFLRSADGLGSGTDDQQSAAGDWNDRDRHPARAPKMMIAMENHYFWWENPL